MTEETRDIAIKTQARLDHLAEQVSKLTETVEGLKDAMTERRGAEKVARWIIGGTAGGIGALATKIGATFMSTPFPK